MVLNVFVTAILIFAFFSTDLVALCSSSLVKDVLDTAASLLSLQLSNRRTVLTTVTLWLN